MRKRPGPKIFASIFYYTKRSKPIINNLFYKESIAIKPNAPPLRTKEQ